MTRPTTPERFCKTEEVAAEIGIHPAEVTDEQMKANEEKPAQGWRRVLD